MSKGTAAWNCMSQGGGELYSGGIARVGTRGDGWGQRQRWDDEGKLRAGGISEAHQRRAEPEGKLEHRKRRLPADPRYACSRTLGILSVAPKGRGPETGGEAELGFRPGVLEVTTHSRADHSLLPDFQFLHSAA